ncbi:hypothetical protein AB0J80_36335 [Actinoplanes sp. NPDC049548]
MFTALALVFAAYAGAARPAGDNPNPVVAVVSPPPDDPNGTCVVCV